MISVGGADTSVHVIVVGNEKGGSGKSTTAMHLAVALMSEGQRIATIDLDGRQKTLSHYIHNRKRWCSRHGLDLPVPRHYVIDRVGGDSVRGNAWAEYEEFGNILASLEGEVDFVIVDTPGSDTPLCRMSHSVADTLVTPLNDSFIDLDVLAAIDPLSHEIVAASHYAKMAVEARKERRAVDGNDINWVVVRNRLGNINTRNRRSITDIMDRLAFQLGLRVGPGITERVIFRELFPMGLTALDPLDEVMSGMRMTMSHLAARQEVRALLAALRLPLNARSRRIHDARIEWTQAGVGPLQLDPMMDLH